MNIYTAKAYEEKWRRHRQSDERDKLLEYAETIRHLSQKETQLINEYLYNCQEKELEVSEKDIDILVSYNEYLKHKIRPEKEEER